MTRAHHDQVHLAESGVNDGLTLQADVMSGPALTGVVYLLHFDRPFRGPMQHYVGLTDNLEQRLEEHRNGTAGATTRRASSQGIGFTLSRTWSPGSRQLERRIKDCGPVNYCPLCPRRPRPSERARSSPIPG
jgi:predicted GIY-YIG superfamily endonuclease